MQHLDEPIIRAERLSAGYGITTVWSDATFTVKRGEFIGLLGANGAGKTTLFRLLLGLDRQQSGDILVFGNAPRRGNARIGYIPQRRFIDDESRIEVIEYVRLGLISGKLGVSLPSQAHDERIASYEALSIVDANHLAHRTLRELSGGELQRIFLAQALVSKPDLLLLDEPLANLDIRRESQLIQLVRDVINRENITAMLIAHNINPLLPAVDRIIYIANGHVVSGLPEEVVTSESLSALYDAPIEVLHDSKGRIAVIGIEEAEPHDK